MRTAIACLVLCSILQGCARFGKTVSVGVFDGDTGDPVTGADVAVSYGRMVYLKCLDFFPPRDNSAITGSDGVARVNISGASSLWDALAAAGTDTTLSISASGYPRHSFSDAEFDWHRFQRREVNGRTIYAVPLYHLPAPQIVIVLPDGYRGPVRITYTFSNSWVQDEPGKRLFEFPASGQGDVEINANPLIYGSFVWDIQESQENTAGRLRFRYANGKEIPRTSAREFGLIKFRTAATQPALPSDMPRAPEARARFQRLRMLNQHAWIPPRPPEFGFDFIASDTSPTRVEPAQRRSLFVVGGEQEMLRFYETYQPLPWRAPSEPMGFEAVWNLR